ncbi:MAG: hypothetical protein M3R36_03685 [Bacteroidota bacterium]|nr:hypothetical protein [Bacteroidota bacterium]
MNNLLINICVVLFSLFTVYDGNSYNKPNEITNYVGGRVLDERNFPVPFVKVIIRGIEAETDKFGKFKILNVTFPYDAVIAERSTSTAVIYKGLSIDNPDFILFGKPNTRNANSAILSIKFPEIPAGSSAVIKFISTDVFYCEDIEIFTGEKSKTLIVYWPAAKKTINGNIIYLQKNSAKYEVYQDIATSLYKREDPFNLKFNENLTPNTRTTDLNVYLPFKDFRVKGYAIFADFLAYDRNAEVMLTRQEGNIFNTKSIIPSNLPISYRLKVSGFVDYPDGSGFVNYVYSKPGATVNLTTETPPELQTPTDKYLGAAGNTEFYYSLGSGTGIFVVQYHCFYPEMNFYIVTEERTAFLNYLSREEFKRASSVEFKWNVRKYLTYFSVNDFAKPKEFNNDIGYKAVLYSSERTFKTGYF